METAAIDFDALPRLTDARAVSPYLFIIAGLVFGIVLVGGATRLTESGLSITEWQLVSGVLPPLTDEAWAAEFAKYSHTPEGQTLHKNIAMSEFKRIYYYEWSHRLLGRVIGLSFLLPIPYFLLKKRITARTTTQLLGIGTLIGGQGALGWYMVSSGLTKEGIAEASPHGVARVSQYRLAAHLLMALVVYASCVRLGLGLWRDTNLARGLGVGGVYANADVAWAQLASPMAARARRKINVLTGLVLLTATSGAFVAGLDAGLIYNEFPYMGEGFVPPREELYDSKYARREDQSDLIPRNVFENPVTAQFNHRVLAMTTLVATLYVLGSVDKRRRYLPPDTRKYMRYAGLMAITQATLGIATLLYMVPLKLAAYHQAGSIVLLTLVVAAGASLRRPSKAAQQWMMARGIARPAKGVDYLWQKPQFRATPTSLTVQLLKDQAKKASS